MRATSTANQIQLHHTHSDRSISCMLCMLNRFQWYLQTFTTLHSHQQHTRDRRLSTDAQHNNVVMPSSTNHHPPAPRLQTSTTYTHCDRREFARCQPPYLRSNDALMLLCTFTSTHSRHSYTRFAPKENSVVCISAEFPCRMPHDNYMCVSVCVELTCNAVERATLSRVPFTYMT